MLKWIEINGDHLTNNLQVFRELAGEKVIIAAGVKANAFGHGIEEVSRIFSQQKNIWLFVNSFEEAQQIRETGITTPILLAGYTQQEKLDQLLELGNIRIITYNTETIQTLGRFKNKKIPVHVLIDTGMNRQGVHPDDLPTFFKEIKKYPNLLLEGIATHYATAEDIENLEYFHHQRNLFETIQIKLNKAGYHPRYIHSANSAAGLLHYKTYSNFIRPACALYGIYPHKSIQAILEKKGLRLLPTMSYKTRIARIQKIKANQPIGYNCEYKTKRKSTIALLPIGYHEAIDRKLSNNAEVLIHGRRARIIGSISMHMSIIDITNIPEAVLEDEVVIIGKQGQEEISIHEIAQKLQTIPHEIMTRIPENIPKIYKYPKKIDQKNQTQQKPCIP
jgi:alanine racemase